ncbi:MAG: Plug domain-containing protein [Pedobacter sp.]|nr:MAG: Plug domain-containing protein [Pedobacter sp.]
MLYFVKKPQWVRSFYGDCTWEVDTAEKIIYLTFDDGPDPSETPFVMEQLERYTNIMTPFSTIPGIITRNGKIYQMASRSLTSTRPILLIVDGVKISQDDNPTFLSSLNIMDVEGIEVLQRGYNLAVYGDDGAAGIIYITTKSGRAMASPSKNIAKLLNIGFQTPKHFYLPDYDDPKQNTGMKDLRTTVYWNPTLKTNDTGEAKISFFNTDITGNYKLVIEGVDIDGNLARKVMTYEVK